MNTVVLKFGGTSLNSDHGRRCSIKHILNYRNKGNKVVVVVSAMGRQGEPYATDTLINLLKKIHSRIDGKKKDLIMSCGEIISATLISHMLESLGIPSIPMAGFQAGILTDSCFTNAKIIDVNTEHIEKKLEKGYVVVVAGFQGITANREITTLGRGGSDTTALALGSALRAKTTDIYTDVPGVLVTDPRIVPEAPILDRISFTQMLDMANNGAKVVHPRAIETAIKYNTSFCVKSTFESGKGTIISKSSAAVPWEIIGIAKKEITSQETKVTVVLNSQDPASITNKLDMFISQYKWDTRNKHVTTSCYQFVIPKNHADLCIRAIFDEFISPISPINVDQKNINESQEATSA